MSNPLGGELAQKPQAPNGLPTGHVEKHHGGKLRMANVKCGIDESSWRRSCMVSMLPFTMYYGFVRLMTSALVSYLASQITTLEKQFGLTSYESGLLMSMNDMGYLITVVFVSYFGRSSHIPRVLAVCCFFFGISAFICTVPYLFTYNSGLPPIHANFVTNITSNMEDQLCLGRFSNVSPQAEQCSISEKSFYSTAKTVAIAFIASGMCLQGTVKAPRTPLFQTYVDDNVPEVKAGFYIGTIFSLGIFGPVLSYGIGGLVSRIYVTLEETHMTPEDPRWIGAWWLGFLLFGFVAIVLSFPLSLFPKRLANAPPDHQSARLSEQNETTTTANSILKSSRGILSALKRLAINPVFAFVSIGVGLRDFGIAGSMTFLPKYVQIHYGLSVFKSNLFVGTLGMGSAGAAVFIGGIITRRFRLDLKGNLKFLIVVQVISSLVMVAGIALYCPMPEVEGFHINSQSKSLEVTSSANSTSCSARCNCDNKFFPVCGSNGFSYFSPCHAGCRWKTTPGYAGCLCISNNTSNSNKSTADAKPGMCRSECSLYAVFAVIQFLNNFIGALGFLSISLITMRCVETRDKSLAVGVTSFSSSLLGWVFAPVVMGHVIDSTCVLRETSCAREGSCALYDIRDFRFAYHGINAVVSLIYISCFLISYIFLLRGGKDRPYSADNKIYDTEQ